MKISAKIAISTISIFVVGVFLFDWFVYKNLSARVDDLFTDRQVELAGYTLNTVSRLLDHYYRDIETIAADDEFKRILAQSDEVERNSSRLNNFLVNLGPWTKLYVINAERKVLLSAPESAVQLTEEDKLALNRALAGQTYYSDVLLDAHTSMPTLIFASPIRQAEKVVGVVMGRLGWRSLIEILLAVGDNYNAYLLNRNGVLIASNNPTHNNLLLKNKLSSECALIKNVMSASRGFVVGESMSAHFEMPLNGHNRGRFLSTIVPEGSFHNYKGNNWSLIIETPFSSVAQIAHSLLANIIFSLLAILGLLIIIVLIMIRRAFLTPLANLSRGAAAIKAGNLDFKVPVISSDELGLLSLSFNEMADRLRQNDIHIAKLIKKLNDDKIFVEKQSEQVNNTKRAILNVLEDEKELEKSLKNQRDNLHTIINSMTEGLLVVDERSGLILINSAAQRIIGLKNKNLADNQIGNIFKLFKNNHLVIDTLIARAIKDGVIVKTILGDDFYLLGEADKKIFISLVISPMATKSRGGAIIVFRDVTVEKEIDVAKNEFISLTSHQLRTPLSAIAWYAEMILDGDAGQTTKKTKEYLKEIYNSNKRMVDLINALLSVSKIEMGTFSIGPFKEIDIADIYKTVINDFKNDLKKKCLILKETHDRNLPLIMADADVIGIVFQNLISNAIKYTYPNGRIKTSLSLDKNNILFSVADSGCGIPENQKQNIFSKMFRADNARLMDPDGTGLGLYIVKSILAKIGGEIRFDSKEGGGTIFYVTIPFGEAVKITNNKKLFS